MQNLLKSRIKKVNSCEVQEGHSIIYVMSRDQRVHDNHALVATLKHCAALKIKPIVLFNLYPSFKNRAFQHYEWMIEGLKEIERDLNGINIEFILNQKSQETINLLQSLKPTAIYFDFSPLKGPTSFRNKIANQMKVPCYVVDTHNIVPVWIISDKEEYAAATFRPKIYKKFQQYLADETLANENITKELTKSIDPASASKIDWEEVMSNITASKLPNYHPIVRSGGSNANLVLKDFIKNKLLQYATKRNDPTQQYQSNLSAYLHFGQISSLRVTYEILKYANENNIKVEFNSNRNKAAKIDIIKTEKDQLKASIEAFLEELIVRKELCDNFCYYNSNYDNVKGGRSWALASLEKHQLDKREHIYTFGQLQNAETHDEAWNGAQRQMTSSGKMHGYMRMYWAKKILEWTENIDTAINYAIKLNDMYELDGADPNGYVGILWSMVGLHDRPWFEREIFGQIRYMNYEGLKRKFDVEKYIRNID
jgi:deoxyribodipyrimidine photo-lyase